MCGVEVTRVVIVYDLDVNDLFVVFGVGEMVSAGVAACGAWVGTGAVATAAELFAAAVCEALARFGRVQMRSLVDNCRTLKVEAFLEFVWSRNGELNLAVSHRYVGK